MTTAELYGVDGLCVGDVIRYPGIPDRARTILKRYGSSDRLEGTDERDFLRIVAIEDGAIRGKRLHPQDWERELVFSVYPVQIRERGFLLVERAGGN